MRTFIIATVFSAVASFTVLTNAAGTMMLMGQNLGHQYWCTVPSTDVTNAPTWATERDNPPVSVREAVRLATKGLAETLGDVKDWHRQDIVLQEWPVKGYWVYEITFGGPSPGSVMTVVVLMNGHVICPKLGKK